MDAFRCCSSNILRKVIRKIKFPGLSCKHETFGQDIALLKTVPLERLTYLALPRETLWLVTNALEQIFVDSRKSSASGKTRTKHKRCSPFVIRKDIGQNLTWQMLTNQRMKAPFQNPGEKDGLRVPKIIKVKVTCRRQQERGKN